MLLPFKSGAVENEQLWEEGTNAGVLDRNASPMAAAGNELRTLRNLMDDGDDTLPRP